MMVTNLNSSILNSAILDSAMLHKTLTQTSSIWLKLIHSHSTWWWQPPWTLPSWIQPFCTKRTSLIHSDSTWWWQPSWILPSLDSAILHKRNFIHSFWLNLMMAAILNSAMLDSDTAILHFQTPCYLLSDSLKNTLPPLWLWLKVIQSD